MPPQIKKRLAIEIVFLVGWERYVGEEVDVLGINTFDDLAKSES
ncbi:hypothetical protein ACUL41_12900 [Virgibacillus natechei]